MSDSNQMRDGAATKSAHSYTATIYCGLKQGYHGPLGTNAEAECICRKYVDRVGLCVTVTPTRYIYSGGEEPGVIVGLINYPRFPKPPEEIRRHALELATQLMGGLHQQRVTVVMEGETVMLGEIAEQCSAAGVEEARHICDFCGFKAKEVYAMPDGRKMCAMCYPKDGMSADTE